MTPGETNTLTSAAHELVYAPATMYLEGPQIVAGKLRFRVKPTSSLSAREIAARLVGPDIGDVLADGLSVVASMSHEPSAPDPNSFFLDNGSFTQSSFAPGRLVLRRRAGEGIAAIELIAVASDDEEWRRFLARDVDLVPFVRPTFRRYLAEVPSVELIGYQAPQTLGLIFQVRHGAFTDVRLRRAVALGIHRGAIARAVLGAGDAAIASAESSPEARHLLDQVRQELGQIPPIRLAFLASLTEDQRAALVLEQQLAELGLNVKLVPVPLKAAIDTIAQGEFDILLTYAGLTPIYFRKALGGSAANNGGYANLEFDRAVAEGSSARAIEILERDVPMTPIFTVSEMVAVDRRFCGVHPIANYDLSWMAEIHVCAKGERP